VPLILSDSGIAKRLTAIIAAYGSTCELALYKADIVPAVTDVAALYTANECSFTGYSRITLTAWGTVSVVHHVASSQELPRVFTRTGGAVESAYGYFVLDNAGVLQFAERFPSGPIVMSGTGQTLSVTLNVSDESKFK